LLRNSSADARAQDNPNLVGLPKVVEVLNPAFVDTPITKTGPNAGEIEYWYGSGAHKVRLPAEDVTHIPFMAMPGAARGLSSIQYAGIAYALALAAMEYGQRWFAQGASPSFILSTEQKLGTPEIERIARKFLIEHSGLTSAHLPLVVDSGLKVEKISSTPDEAQYLATLEYSRNVVGAWFGLPPHLVGGSNEKAAPWGKTLQEQGFQLEDFTLSGYIVPLEEVHSSFLPSDQLAGFDEAQIRRADSTALAGLITATRTTAVKTPNEVRVHDLHMRPLPGGDDLGIPLNSNTSPPVGTILGDELAKSEGVPPPAAPAPEEGP
jgi:HK97 family phage portal protein